MWPLKRGGLSGIEFNTFMLRFPMSSGLSIGVGLSSGWPHERGSTVTPKPVYEQKEAKMSNKAASLVLLTYSNPRACPPAIGPVRRVVLW